MTAIEADHYREEVDDLIKDPIIQKMTDDVVSVPDSVLGVEVDGPDFQLMNTSNHEYNRRGGKRARTLGGPAKAILKLRNIPRKDWPKDV